MNRFEIIVLFSLLVFCLIFGLNWKIGFLQCQNFLHLYQIIGTENSITSSLSVPKQCRRCSSSPAAPAKMSGLRVPHRCFLCFLIVQFFWNSVSVFTSKVVRTLHISSMRMAKETESIVGLSELYYSAFKCLPVKGCLVDLKTNSIIDLTDCLAHVLLKTVGSGLGDKEMELNMPFDSIFFIKNKEVFEHSKKFKENCNSLLQVASSFGFTEISTITRTSKDGNLSISICLIYYGF